MDKPEPDYPAAHSMDTEWYAVDADGHIGLFNSGEAGAMPVQALTSYANSPTRLAEAIGLTLHSLLDWLGDDSREHHVQLPERESGDPLGKMLMFLSNTELAQDEILSSRAEQEPAFEGSAVLFHDLSVELAWRLHETGVCLGCFAWSEEERGYHFYDDLPRRIGLFRFDHDDKAENWISGSYLRDPAPPRSLRLEQLPAEFRESIGRIRFEGIRFAEVDRIQPVAHFPRESWQSVYLDSDGVTVRPMPGREAEFNAEAWARIPGLRVEPPGQAPPGRARPG